MRNAKRKIVWEELRRLEAAGLGRAEAVDLGADRFVVAPDHPAAPRLLLPADGPFIVSDEEGLALHRLAPKLRSILPATIRSLSRGARDGLRLDWSVLEPEHIEAIFSVLEVVAGDPAFDPAGTYSAAQETADMHAEAAEFVAAPADSLAFPLIAPLCRLLALVEPIDPELDDVVPEPASFDALDADPGLATIEAQAAALYAADVVSHYVHLLLGGDLAAARIGAAQDLPLGAYTRPFRAWLRSARPPVAEAALVVASLAQGSTPWYVVPGRRPARELVRELYRYAREHGIGTWGDAHRHAVEHWSRPEVLAEVLLTAWRATLLELNAMVRLHQAAGAEAAAGMDRPLPPAPGRAPPPAQPQSATGAAADAALREEVEQLRAGARDLSDQVSRGAAEVAQLRAARDQARFRVRALEAELEPLRAELERERRNARGLRNQLEELRATIEAESADPIEPLPEAGWPADLLAGVTILLFTGQARAGAREAMADELREVGATVEVRETSGPRSIPDRVSGDCVIVADVRFMPHMWSDAVAECARRSGARHLEVRSGQGGIVRAVARGLGRG